LDDNLLLEQRCACREVIQRWSKLASGQAATVASPSEPLQHEPPAKKRILIIGYAATRARSEGALPPPRGQGSLAKATMARAMVSSPPLTTDEVDRLYHQLTEIHSIGAAQLAECAHWGRSDSTPSPGQARTNWQRPDGTSFMTRTAPPPSTDFFSKASL
jgi:hypothetical protein